MKTCSDCGWLVTPLNASKFAPMETGHCVIVGMKKNPQMMACTVFQENVTQIDIRRIDLALYHRRKRV